MAEQIERADVGPPPGPPETGSTARDALDVADLHGRLGSEEATATEARIARPNVQVPGNTCRNGLPATRQGDGGLLPGGADARPTLEARKESARVHQQQIIDLANQQRDARTHGTVVHGVRGGHGSPR